MHKAKFQSILLLALVAGLLLAACQPQAAPATSAAGGTTGGGSTTGGTTTGGSTTGGGAAAVTISKNLLLDPALAVDADSKSVNADLYEGLLVFADNAATPALAQSWEVSDDGLSYTFHLRAAASFHDGTPVTAEAVMANFNRWFDPADALHGAGTYPGWAAAMGGFKGETDTDGHPKSAFDGIEKVDNLTVLVHLNRADPDFPTKLTQAPFAIVNPAALQAAGAAYGTNGQVSGTGPYMVGSWTGDTLELTPNPAYWNGAPAAGVTFKLQ